MYGRQGFGANQAQQASGMSRQSAQYGMGGSPQMPAAEEHGIIGQNNGNQYLDDANTDLFQFKVPPKQGNYGEVGDRMEIQSSNEHLQQKVQPRESDRISVMSAQPSTSQPQMQGYDGRRFPGGSMHKKAPGRNFGHVPRERVNLCDSPTVQSEEGGRKPNRLQMNLRRHSKVPRRAYDSQDEGVSSEGMNASLPKGVGQQHMSKEDPVFTINHKAQPAIGNTRYSMGHDPQFLEHYMPHPQKMPPAQEQRAFAQYNRVPQEAAATRDPQLYNYMNQQLNMADNRSHDGNMPDNYEQRQATAARDANQPSLARAYRGGVSFRPRSHTDKQYAKAKYATAEAGYGTQAMPYGPPQQDAYYDPMGGAAPADPSPEEAFRRARAARVILKAFRVNLLLKRALRGRIAIEASTAAALLARAIRRLVERVRSRNLRRRGYFYATIYLECSATGHSSHERLQPHHRVEVFGEFSEERPWEDRKVCRYDSRLQCFRADLLIKTGHMFKFVVDNGRHYCHSDRYAQRWDDAGNCNNVYEPKQIEWVFGERKKASAKPVMPPEQQPMASRFPERRVMPPELGMNTRYSHAPPSPLSPTQVEMLSPNAMSRLPDYLGFDNIGSSSGGDRRFPLRRIGGDPTQRGQPSPATAVQQHVPIKTAPFSIPNMQRSGAAPPMPMQLPIGQIETAINRNIGVSAYSNTHPRNERGESYSSTRYEPEPQSTAARRVNEAALYEPPAAVTNAHRDFMSEFEEFFRGEPIRGHKASVGQSGSSRASTGFQQEEEDEYLENLRLSGAFPEAQLATTGKLKSTPTDLGISPIFRDEFEQQKEFENVFDLTEDKDRSSDEATSVKLTAAQFRQYSMPFQIRKLKSNQSGTFLKKNSKPELKAVKAGKEGPPSGGKSPPSTQKKDPVPKAEPKKSKPVMTTAQVKAQAQKTISPRQNLSGNLQKLEASKGDEAAGTRGVEPTVPDPKQQRDQAAIVKANQDKAIGRSPSKGSNIGSEKKTALSGGRPGSKQASAKKVPSLADKPMPTPEKKDSGQRIIETQPPKVVPQMTSEAAPPSNAKNYSTQPLIHAIGKLAQDDVKAPQPILDSQQKSEPLTRDEEVREPAADEMFEIKHFSPQDGKELDEKPRSVDSGRGDASSVKGPAPIEFGAPASMAKAQSLPARDGTPTTKKQAEPEKELEHQREHAMSECSGFQYVDHESYDEEEAKYGEQNSQFILIQGATAIGKEPHQCEDAYFLSERAFGVSDGVSGWNVYGFSSDQFSLQLMFFSKQLIDHYIRRGVRSKKDKKSLARSARGLRRNSRSMLSMDNLDVEESGSDSDSGSSGSGDAESSNDEPGSKNSKSDQKKTLQNQNSTGSFHDDTQIRPSKMKTELSPKAHAGPNKLKTDRTAEPVLEATHSPILSPDNRKSQELTLEEEVERKMNAEKITQKMVDDWRSHKTGDAQAQLDTLKMNLNKKHYEIELFPTFILQKAFSKVNAVGSATALVAILNKDELHVANIGDSGFLIIRFKNGEPYVPYKSKEQQHSFNIPYQLSQLPTKADLEILMKLGKKEEVQKLRKILRKKNNVCQDTPEAADDYTVPLKDGDVCISASDGVLDNLFQHEILTIVKDYRAKQPGNQLKSHAQASELSSVLVHAAIAKFKNPEGAKTPYQRKYKKAQNETWVGGKEDDITVLVSVARRVVDKVQKGDQGQMA